jgi:hypothetical protein
VATYGAEIWTLNKDIAKHLAAFERKVLRSIFGETKVNENWKKQYNKELLQLFGYLNVISFVRIIWLSWVGHVNGMDSKRKVSQVFSNHAQ